MKSHRYRSVVFGLCVLFAGIDPAAGVDETSGRGRHSKDGALFSASRYRTNVEYLASDALEGRGTGQEGIDKAARFIAERFERMGVQPAGDDGSYFQDFTLRIKRRIGMGTRLAVEAGDSTHRGKLHGDFVPLPPSGKGTFSGDVVFAGYGIVTDDYNDYEGLDVADKVVLVLRRTPAFGEFGISDAVFSGKGRRASDRDAAAVLVVNRPDDGDALFDYESARRGRSAGVPMVQISRALADEMLASADMPDVAALEKKIEKRQKPISQVLKGVSVRGRVAIRRVKTPARNIVGVIPGTGPQKDEYIVVGGHYDHLGIRNKGKAGFDPAKDISNGADDNASGTTGVLTIANAFSQGAKPNRSILVMLFTGEELGLLGSQHFAKHPTIPLDKCAAMINMDMIGRLKNDKLEVGGMRTGEGLEEIVHRHAETYGFKIRDGGGGRGPSDHTNFYNKKIPVLFFFTGLHKQYHRPEDDSPLLNIEGAIRVTKLVADCIDDIDARPERPAFAADTRRMELAWQREGKEPKEDTPVAAAPNAGQRVRLGIMPVPDEDESGIAIGRVLDDSPADRAGMREGDRIVKIGDTTIGAIGDVIAALGGFNRGDSTTVVVQRGGNNVSLDVRFDAAGKPAAPRATAEMRANGKTIAALIDAVMSIHAIRAGAGAPRSAAVNRADDRITAYVVPLDASALKGPSDGEAIAESVDEAVSALKAFVAGESGAYAFTMHYSGGALTLSVQRQAPADAVAYAARGRFDRPDAKPARRAKKNEKAQRRKKDVKSKPKADPHAAMAEDADSLPAMPSVRLGIMPSYGESEGPGYEISGVVDGGPAKKAGMKDSDRIFKIGKYKIMDVYGYMEALQGYKPGDKIDVTVLRDGKKIKLIIIGGATKSQEAA